MKRSDFCYSLPEELIALNPPDERTASRLLVLHGDSGRLEHRRFVDLLDYLSADDLLVFNDTRVIPARLFARKETGGVVEIMVERLLASDRVLAHLRDNKTPRLGARLALTALEGGESSDDCVTLLAKHGALYELQFSRPVLEVLEKLGHMPLPPYIDRSDNAADRERYQTVYARRPGAVAAPTAGLHFSEDFLQRCRDRGVDMAFVTLHVGAGTFQPVRVEELSEHLMHSEYIEVSDQVCEKIRATRERGGRVVAVGTTAVRSLESAAQAAAGQDGLQAFHGDSQLFIYPPYRFRVVDAMVTNFHLPESTLIMLVSAFAGHSNIMAAYEEAVRERYRFFSYGDAMLIFPNKEELL